MVKALALALILGLTGPQAFAGRDGNGGNDIALRFTQIAKDSLKFLKGPGKNTYNLDLVKLENSIKDVQVYVVTYKLCVDDGDKLCPNEEGFVAKNYAGKNEIYVNSQKWQALGLEKKIRITLHEYLGIVGVEIGNYDISSSIVIAVDFKETTQYACQMSLVQKQYPAKVLGSAGFIVDTADVKGEMKTAPIQGRKQDVIFRVVSGKNYLRGTVELGLVDREFKGFPLVQSVQTKIFQNVTFFDGEPIGVKLFTYGPYTLQVSCSYI